MLLDTYPLLTSMSGRLGDSTLGQQPPKKGGRVDLWPQFKRQNRPLNTRGFSGLSRLAFRYADTAYSMMSPQDRQHWKNAVKAPNTTAYTLWMSECMTCILAFGYPPVAPSDSGGFSASHVQQGFNPISKQLDCAEVPYEQRVEAGHRTAVFPTPPGKYTYAVTWGAIKWWPPSGPGYAWNQDPPSPDAFVKVFILGHPELTRDFGNLTPTGWPTFDQAGVATSDRPRNLDIPSDTYGCAIEVGLPAGWSMAGYLNLVIGTRPQRMSKAHSWQP